MGFQEIVQLAPQYGIAAGSMWIIYKIVGNHINHNTEALKDLSVAVTKLITYLETRDRA